MRGKELRRNKRKIALFWDDLYPKTPKPQNPMLYTPNLINIIQMVDHPLVST